MPADEANTNRRRLFSRTEMPMQITINGHLMPVLNWSLGGVALAKPCPLSLQPDDTVIGVLELLMGGVDLSVKVTLRLANEQPDRLGFAFVGMSPEQMGMLRALLVRGGGTPLERAPLSVHANGSASSARQHRGAFWSRRRRFGRILGRVAAGVALLAAFGAIGAYGLIKKANVEAVEAAVAVPTQLAVGVDRGYVDRVIVKPGQMVTAGEALLSLRRRAEPAKAVVVASPCRCTVINVLARPGDEVTAGEPLVQLTASQPGEPFIEALVPASLDLAVGQPVKVAVEGSNAIGRGRVAELNAEPKAFSHFGLPEVLRRDPRYQMIIVDDLSGLNSLTPGTAVRLQLNEDASWTQRLRGELARLGDRARRMLAPVSGDGIGAAG